MSHISWGTMGRVLKEAENALVRSSQVGAAKKLAKAIGYINAVNHSVSKEPRRFSEKDIEKLQQVVHCLRGTGLTARAKKEDYSEYLAKGSLAIKALQEAKGSVQKLNPGLPTTSPSMAQSPCNSLTGNH